MRMTVSRWMALVVLTGAVAGCYAGVDVEEPEESTEEAASALTCQGSCQADLFECTSTCPPDDPWLSTNPCVDQCYEYYSQCLNGC